MAGNGQATSCALLRCSGLHVPFFSDIARTQTEVCLRHGYSHIQYNNMRDTNAIQTTAAEASSTVDDTSIEVSAADVMQPCRVR